MGSHFCWKFVTLLIVAGFAVGATQTIDAQGILDRARQAAEQAAKRAEEARKTAEEARKAAEAAKAAETQTTPATPGGGNPQANSPNAATPASPARGGAQSQPVTLADLENGSPAAPAQLGEWKQMPDAAGVHLHMPIDGAIAHLKQQYGKPQLFQLMTRPPLSPSANVPQKEHATSLRIEFAATAYQRDNVEVFFTEPPNPQVVWGITRDVVYPYNEPLNRGTLLAALREKFGRETSAFRGERVAANDREIVDMVWLFDEQARPAPRSPAMSVAYDMTNCSRGDMFGGNTSQLIQREQSPLCGGYVRAHVELTTSGTEDLISAYSVRVANFPLSIRAAKATIAWQEAEMEKLRQQELERSKQVKPKL